MRAAERVVAVALLSGLVLSAGFATPARGQCLPEWTQRFDVPAGQRLHDLAFDAKRGVTVLYGGITGGNADRVLGTWEWDGAVWRRLDLPGPAANFCCGDMVYDTRRETILLFGVIFRTRSPQLWEYNGVAWTLIATDGPEAIGRRTMAYDSARGVVVLWGEDVGTWEWDGLSWAQRDPGPAANVGFQMVYDSRRQVTVMFGTLGGQGQTLEWDGQGWELRSTSGPSGRLYQAMGYDSARGVTVMHGGFRSGAPRLDDTWTWDGVSWTQVAAGTPEGREMHAMAFDSIRGEMILFGGQDRSGRHFSDTWAFDGQTWRLRDEGEPLARHAHGMIFDTQRDVTVSFGGIGGSGETWIHNGTRWRFATAGGPAPRHWPSMAFDAKRGVGVLFAGAAGNEPIGSDTWVWNGAEWSFVTDVGPEPRFAAAMAYDSSRAVCVLFGGFAGAIDGGFFGDTWQWNGADWTLVAVTGPSPRSGSSMAYDTHRETTVLFGGFFKPEQGANVFHRDTWEWIGSRWELRSETGPSGRLGAMMAYDQRQGLTILFGGQDADGDMLDDCWAWDGETWRELNLAGPQERWSGAMIYDRARERLLLHAGDDDFNRLADTWELVTSPHTMGDVNCDCKFDALDIEPFIVALFDPESYVTLFPDCDINLADLNDDGEVNALDIEPFITLLFKP